MNSTLNKAHMPWGINDRLSKNYINNADLLAEVVRFKKSGIVSEELGKMLLTVANNYSSKGSFVGYTWRSDMVAEAVLTCIKYLKNFNPEKSSNAFAYITQICKNSFKLYIKEQNKHSKIKDICYNSAETFNLECEVFYSQKSLDYEQMLNNSTNRSTDEEKWAGLYNEEYVNEEKIPSLN